MLSYAIIWDVLKVAFFPLVGAIWVSITRKISNLENGIARVKEESTLLKQDLIRLEERAVTKEELQKLLNEFEVRIDKTIAQNLKPLEVLIKQAITKDGE
jgi:hypothetical protein